MATAGKKAFFTEFWCSLANHDFVPISFHSCLHSAAWPIYLEIGRGEGVGRRFPVTQETMPLLSA